MAGSVDIRLVLNHLNLASQLEERLNAKREDWCLNPTQMLVLAELQERARWRRKPVGLEASASELAALLQRSRSMVAIQLKGLNDKGLVQIKEPELGEDRRSRRYSLTKAGDRRATDVKLLLEQLSVLLRSSVEHVKARAYERALRTIVKELPQAPALTADHTARLYRDEMVRKRRVDPVATTGRKRA
jgi:DNA-binding MarR family transcriptional regulator